MFKTVKFIGAAAVLIGIAMSIAGSNAQAASPQQTSWEVSGEFDSSCPTSGSVWSYLSKTTPVNSTPAAMIPTTVAPPLAGCQDASGPLPHVVHNSNPTPITFTGPQGVTRAARGVSLHPGPNCEQAIVRFTTPYSGTYAVTGQFYGIDGNGSATKTQVSIVGLGAYSTPILTDTIDVGGSKIRAAFRKSFLIAAGKTVDFVVGCQAGGNYNYGTTGLHAVIEYWGKGRLPKPLDNPFAGGSNIGTVDSDPKDPR